MPTFLCFLNWTDQGAKNTKDIVKRYQDSKAVVEKLGGRMLSVYVTTGQYDVVVTVEKPNGETMMKYVTAISATGNARTTPGSGRISHFEIEDCAVGHTKRVAAHVRWV